jgi:protocatechuate 3,4-dioxygenase beta subunit
MKRFGLVTAAALVGAVASGCTGSTPPGPAASTSTASTSAAAARSCSRPAVGPVEPGSVLVPGPTNGLPPSGVQAERMTIVAAVLDGACAPAAGAGVRVWHTDAAGEYGPTGTERCCYYEGTVTADANGRFRLDTIRPAQYPQPNAPPAHIHLEIRHPSGRLDTEIVFTDGPAAPGPVLPSQLIAVPLTRAGTASGAPWYGEVTFALA